MSDPLALKPVAALAKAVTDNRVDATMGQHLVKTYTPFFEQAAPLVAEAKDLRVTDPSQVDEIGRSVELRKKLQRLRLDAEGVRKNMKAGVLGLGRAIDFGNNLLLEQILPWETQMEENETIAQRIAAERKAKVGAERRKLLAAEEAEWHLSDLELGSIPEPQFKNDLAILVDAKKRRAEEAKTEEAARLAREMEEEERQAEQEAENERLRKQAAEDKRKADEAQAALDAERKARTDAEAETRRVAAQAKAKADAEENARKKAAAAPDKEKLIALAQQLSEFPMPTMATEDGGMVARGIRNRLIKFAGEIVETAGRL